MLYGVQHGSGSVGVMCGIHYSSENRVCSMRYAVVVMLCCMGCSEVAWVCYKA